MAVLNDVDAGYCRTYVSPGSIAGVVPGRGLVPRQLIELTESVGDPAAVFAALSSVVGDALNRDLSQPLPDDTLLGNAGD